MNMEAYQQSIHYQAMGIHLALNNHKRDSHLCRALEEAIGNQDWTTLQVIQSCFNALDARDRALILSGIGHPQRIANAIAHLEIKVYLDEAWRDILEARLVMGLPTLH